MAPSKKGFMDGLLAVITVALLLAAGLFALGSSLTGHAVRAPVSEDQVFLFFSRPGNATVGELVTFMVFPDDAQSSITARDEQGNIRVIDGDRAVFDAPGVYVIDALVYLGEQKERFSEEITVEAPQEEAQEIMGGSASDATSLPARQGGDGAVPDDADDGVQEHVIHLEWKDLEAPAPKTTQIQDSAEAPDDKAAGQDEESQLVQPSSARDEQDIRPQPSAPPLADPPMEVAP